MAYCSRSEYQQAIADFDRALALDPTYAWAYVLRGGAFSAGEECQRAIADFDQALALDARAALAYALRGIDYKERSEYQRAIADFDRALAGVARCRYSLFDHGTAIEDCTPHLLDQIGDRDSPRAAFRAIEHRAAAKDSQTVTENCQAQRCATVTTIEEEAVCIHNGGRPDPCGIAPGHGARRGAGSTQNALRTLIVTSALLRRLETLGEWWGLIVDEVRFDLLILGEKRIQVNHQVFDHPERQQRHNGDLVRQTPHQELTGQAIQPIDAHRIRAADAMATGAAKGE